MLDRLEDLGALLRSWRLERDPSEVAGIVDTRRRRIHLTQLDMGVLLGVTERWYAALERGEPRQYSRSMVDGIVEVLRLSSEQADLLYRGTGHGRVVRASTPGEADPALLGIMNQQPYPSWISDVAWDIVAANPIARQHFPWIIEPRANVMKWALSPDARSQLHSWQDRWSDALIGQLRASWQRWPDEPRLTEVVHEVRQLPGIEGRWGKSTHAQATPYADVRPVVLPLISQNPLNVEILAFSRFSDDTLRWIILVPEDPTVRFDMPR